MLKTATFQEEQSYWNTGKKAIVGLDEVGRGSWAGPVVVAGVIFPSDCVLDFALADSKLLSPQIRENLVDKIKQASIAYAVSEVSVVAINKQGIGKATQRAFRKTLAKLKDLYDFIFVDAFYVNHISKNIQKPIIHGDQISATIAAASIIAKVYRDGLMVKLHETYPNYRFDIHKGYGTKAHQQAIRNFGLSEVHRTSFALTKYCRP